MTLDEIYSKIPRLACKRRCGDQCTALMLSDYEQTLIDETIGKTDFSLETGMKRGCIACPKLVKGSCSIYELRPLVCRLFGVVKKMKCTHGCKPKRWLSDLEAKELIRAAEEL